MRKKWFFFIIMILTVLLGLYIPSFEMDHTTPSWFGKDSRRIQRLNEFKQLFGNQGANYMTFGIKIENKDVQKTLLPKIHQEIESIKHVKNVASYVNYKKFYFEGLDLKFMNSFLGGEIDSKITNYFVSKDQSYYVFYAEVDDESDLNHDRSKLVNDFRKLQDSYVNYPNSLVGTNYITEMFNELGQKDLFYIFPVISFFIIVFVYLKFKSFFLLFASSFIFLLSSIQCLGFISMLGLKGNIIVLITPGIIFAIVISDIVHIWSHIIKSDDLNQRIQNSFTSNFTPTLLTSITTSIGFFSLMTSEMVPIKVFSITAGIGVLLSWVNVYLVFPLFIDVFKAHFDVEQLKELNLKLYFNFLKKYSKSILFLFLITIVYTGYRACLLEINSDVLSYFPEKSSILKGYNLSKEKLNSSVRRFHFMVDSKKKDGVYDEAFYQQLKMFINWLKAKPEIKKVFSYQDELNLCPDRQSKQKCHRLFQEGFRDNFGVVKLDKSKRFAKLRVIWSEERTKQGLEKSQLYLKYARESLGLDIKIRGFFKIYSEINEMVVKTLRNSMLISIILLFCILIFILKNLWFSLLSVLSSIFPMVMTLGIMEMIDIPLNISTAIVFSICLGIAIDDTIHIFFWISKTKESNMIKKIELSYKKMSSSILFTSLLLIVSFGSYGLADFIPTKNFGVLSAIGIFIALIFDFILIPTLLINSSQEFE